MNTDTPIYHQLLDEFADTYPCKGDPREGGYYPGCDCTKCQAWKSDFHGPTFPSFTWMMQH